MPQGIRYTTSSLSGSLRKGNTAIGITGNLGPTSTTGFYTSVPPTSGRYVVSEVFPSSNPIFFAPTDTAELTRLARQEGATGANTGSVGAILSWIITQPNLAAINFTYPSIPTDGITFITDIGTTLCYPQTGPSASSIDPNASTGFIEGQNGVVFTTEYSGGFSFDGADDVAYTNLTTGGGFGINNTAAFTFVSIARSLQANWSGNNGIGNNIYSDGTGFSIANSPSTRNVIYYMGSTSGPFTVNIGTITPANITVPHMYVISSNGTNLHKGYVDNGSPITSTTTITRAAARREIFIGRNGYAGQNTNMVAYVQIYYNRQLSDAEVLQLYSAYQSRFGF